jgi:hypothetical protein
MDAFTARYGAGKPIAGAWSAADKLSNGGEILTLSYGLVTPPIFSFAYNDNPTLNWPTTPDGLGASLVKISPEDLTRDPNLGINWRSSTPTPGTDDRVKFVTWLGATPAGDPDHDGLDNLVEYALGGDATKDNSELIPTANFQPYSVSGVPATYATLTFQRSILHEDFTQHVEFSTNLSTWPINAIQVTSTDNGNGTRTESWRSSTPVEANTRIFGRVRFTQP